MSFPTTYFLNVALHAAILSVVANLALMFLSQARHRSVIAIAGLLAVGFLPWISALRPIPAQSFTVPERETAARSLPSWTIATLPAPATEPLDTAPAHVKFISPDPLTGGLGLWLFGAIVGVSLLIIAWLRASIWNRSFCHLDAAHSATLHSLALEIPDTACFRICETNNSPCVTRFRKPLIALPRFLFDPGSEEKLGWAVRHELAHFHAGDSRWVAIFAVIRSVNWWNPLAYRLISVWADAREQLCDLRAAGVTESRADYGEFLIAMARTVGKPAPLTVAMAVNPHALRLKRRIVSLLKAGADSAEPVGKRFIGIGCCLSLCCAAVVSCMKVGSGGAEAGAILSGSKTSPLATRGSSDAGDWANPEGPLHIKITSTFMVTSPDTNFGGGSCSDKGVKRIMRDFEKIGKATLSSTPSVSARPGQSTTIEIIHEVLESGHPTKTGATKSPAPFVGITLKCVPRIPLPGGLAVDLHQIVDYRYVPGIWRFDGTDAKPPAGLLSEKIKILSRTIDSPLLSGNTYVSRLGEIEPGKYLTLLTKAEIIDATGRSLKLPE